jgi:adenylate kinase
MNIIILGPQGSGKGTQAKLLADEFDLFYFESGNFLRKLAEENERIDRIINKEGKLLPDEETFSYVKEELEEKVPGRDGIILDGYPRSIKQYRLLTDWLQEKGKDIDYVIFLDISEKESIRRLSARRMDKETGKIYNLITNPPSESVEEKNLVQRADDKPGAIKIRLEQYKKETKPLVDLLREKGVLMEVDGERPIQVILEDIVGRIKHGQG